MTTKKKGSGFAALQRMGRSLMLPIATLPAAGLLLRLGQADVLGADGLSKHLSWMQPVADVLAAAGGAVFDNLPLIFAVGVAVGFAKKSDGSTAVAGLFGFLVFKGVLDALAKFWGAPAGPDAKINYGVLAVSSSASLPLCYGSVSTVLSCRTGSPSSVDAVLSRLSPPAQQF